MGGLDKGEVPSVRGENGSDPQPLGNGYKGRVDKPDIGVRVLFQDLDGPGHVGACYLLDRHLPIVQGDEESRFRERAEAAVQEIARFRPEHC